jgi:hypothetical protein
VRGKWVYVSVNIAINSFPDFGGSTIDLAIETLEDGNCEWTVQHASHSGMARVGISPTLVGAITAAEAAADELAAQR